MAGDLGSRGIEKFGEDLDLDCVGAVIGSEVQFWKIPWIGQSLVEDNILLPVWTTRPQDATARLQATYDVIPELRPLAKRRTTQLSGGQQQIVALARAITGGTRLLLLDEPLEGVAPALAERICDVIGGLKRLGVSALVAESDTKGLTRALDRVYVIERGTISAG